jgi:hypothetical protein
MRGSSLIPQLTPKVAGVAGNYRKPAGAATLLLFDSPSSIDESTRWDHRWLHLTERKLKPPVSRAFVAGIGKSSRPDRSFSPSFLSLQVSTWRALSIDRLIKTRWSFWDRFYAVKRPDGGGRSAVSRQRRGEATGSFWASPKHTQYIYLNPTVQILWCWNQRLRLNQI